MAELHQIATILAPGDFVVLHMDGTIDAVPRGMGNPGMYRRNSCPYADLSYIPKWKLDMKHFSHVRHQCKVDVEQAIRGMDGLADSLEKYFRHVAEVNIAMDFIKAYADKPEAELSWLATGGDARRIMEFIQQENIDTEPFRKFAVDAVKKEMTQLFPHSDLLDCVKECDERPYVRVDKGRLKERLLEKLKARKTALDDPVKALDVVNELRECARNSLGGLQTTDVAQKHIDDLLTYPRRMKEKSLRPLVYAAIGDPFHTVKLSMGLGTGFFNPHYAGMPDIASWNNLSKTFEFGSEAPSHEQLYSAEQLNGRPLPWPLSSARSYGAATEKQEYIVLEELVHGALDAIFKTHSLPYDGYTPKLEKKYADAISHDLSAPVKRERLGLHRYPERSIPVEAVAKVIVYAEKEGMEAARRDFPSITAYVEKHVLPAAVKQCRALGIDPERGIVSQDGIGEGGSHASRAGGRWSGWWRS